MLPLLLMLLSIVGTQNLKYTGQLDKITLKSSEKLP